ncbi:MAG: hypothetical protein J0M04_18035 [Verrucomicrobia bacterium]|nr:hypothetical protein [Verrucomicrobiota bacterium]
MKRLFFRWIPALLAGWLMSSCAPQKEDARKNNDPDGPPVFVPVGGDAGPDDMARFLAGRPVRHGKTVSDLQQTPEYAAHEAAMRGMWTGLTRHRVARMSEWSALNVQPSFSSDRVLFYPFGGPDLLHAEALFSNIPTKILMGLEPVGWLPNTAPVSATDLMAALPAYREATRTQMQIGYFITKDMKTDLDASVLRGVTPVVLATVSLMGGTVLNVNAMAAGPYQAVRVDYRNAAGDSNTVIYVCGDLSNGGFRNYRAFLDSYGRGTTYFKAASYLMHDDYFSQARDYFLSASNNVIEDDSGIPFRFFAPALWDIHPYGNYEAPIPLFAKHMQNDLREAYLAVPNRPLLPFGSGYHYGTETANLIHAVRK